MKKRQRVGTNQKDKQPPKATSVPRPSPAAPPPTRPADPEVQALRELVVRLIREGDTEQAISAVDALLTLIEKLRAENNHQALKLARLIKERYGRSSERLDPGQLSLFIASVASEGREEGPAEGKGGEEEPPADPEKIVGQELNELRELKKKDKAKRQRRGRNPLPDSLPRETIRIPIADEKRTCSTCGTKKVPCGVECSNVLEYVPGHLKVIVYEREKAACRTCCDGVVCADPADKLVDRGRPGPGLLAHLVTAKYLEHMPIHRIAQHFAHLGAPLPASTLGDWIAKAADALKPLYKALCNKVLNAYVLGADDTGVRVLDRDHPAGVRKGYFWSYVGYDNTGQPRHAVFEYAPDRKGEHPRTFLDDRRGYVQGDGYQGLDRLFTGPAPPARINVGCHMHFRRYFTEALDAGDLRAAIPLEMFQQLYAVEALATERDADVTQRLALRQQHSTLIIERLHSWMVKQFPSVEPKSPLGQALTYGVNQWDSMKVFLTDGAIPIDNGEVERRIRPLALGRKNWLFVGSDAAGQRAAILYSLIASCSLAGIPPEPWLRDTLTTLSKGWLLSRIPELLPHP